MKTKQRPQSRWLFTDASYCGSSQDVVEDYRDALWAAEVKQSLVVTSVDHLDILLTLTIIPYCHFEFMVHTD